MSSQNPFLGMGGRGSLQMGELSMLQVETKRSLAYLANRIAAYEAIESRLDPQVPHAKAMRWSLLQLTRLFVEASINTGNSVSYV